ncbi:MAG: PDZ domain-containing protein [Anaerolineae bacterium]|nr:MAG: PDZ domain-containing protein [Anaerolineae bacterium]
MKDGPAQAAGLKVGDRILSVDGQAVDADNTLPALIGAFQPGDKVTLEVASGTAAETRDVSVTLGQHPDKEGIGYLGVREAAGAGKWQRRSGPALPLWRAGWAKW